MNTQLAYLYLLSPLHTGASSQEGNLLGIAKEVHTELPYLPSSTLRGRLRAETKDKQQQIMLWGNTIEDVKAGQAENLTQGSVWLGDAAVLWFPVPSLSHGVVWVSSPLLLRRWLRFTKQTAEIPPVGSFSGGNQKSLYLRDAIFQANSTDLHAWSKEQWEKFIPAGSQETSTITEVLVLSDQDCKILIESSLWRQVRVNLDDQKGTGALRYEEAIPPETLMYFPWGTTTTLSDADKQIVFDLMRSLLSDNTIQQFGGQESLGRGLVELWTESNQAERSPQLQEK